MNRKKPKILLTGSNGFIGKNIKESYLNEKYEIIVPSSSELNLLNTYCVNEYFKDKIFDIVLHAAGKPGHRNAKNHDDLCKSNVLMFENLVLNKNKFDKFINLGSGAIYNIAFDIKNVKEEEIFNQIPNDEHGKCKYIVAKQIENLENFVDLNIFGIFGRYEDFEIRFISNAICKTLFDLSITLRQNRIFSYLYIDDLIPILEFFIENKVKYKNYNIVPDEKIELLNLAKMILKISKKDLQIKIAKEGLGLEYTGNNKRLKNEMKNLKFLDVELCVCKLYDYYKENIDKIDKKLLLTDK